jgi:hypothetical protein
MLTRCRESRSHLLWLPLLAILCCPCTSSAQTKMRASQINLGDNFPFTGNITATTGQNTANFYNTNGKKIVDGVKYPFTQAGIVACLNDALQSNGGVGICDASMAPSITFTSELNIKNNTGVDSLTLILPIMATWTFNITDGTSCGIKQFDKTNILGWGTSSDTLFSIVPAGAGSNMSALYCTATGTYYRAEGFGAVNTVGATLVNGAMLIQHSADGSQFNRLSTLNTNGIGIRVGDVCCGAQFHDILANGQSGAGARPCVIGDSAIGGSGFGGMVDVAWEGGSCTHPGTGLKAMEIGGGINTDGLKIDSTYMEPNASDTTTPCGSIGPRAHNITIINSQCDNIAGGSTAYAWDIVTWAGPSDSTFIGIKAQSGNCVNDHITGVVIQTNGTNGQCRPYISPASLSTVDYCGATTGGTQACAKTLQAFPIVVWGDVQLDTSTSQSITTLPFSDSFYSCTGSDLTTAAGIVSFNTYASASVTIQETGGVNTDHLRYICVGR